MKLIELLPKEKNHWFSAIFQIAESNIINEEIVDKKENSYISSNYYETNLTTNIHIYERYNHLRL